MRYFLNKILLVSFFLLPAYVLAQKVEGINAKKLLINYDKTLHLIFPCEIKYFNIGTEDYVLGDRPEEVKNILRLKANQEKFEGETNVSVVTSDGKYYLYLVSYSDSLPYTYLDLKEQYRTPTPITVSEDKYVHLIFPTKVKYIDYGNSTISVMKADGVDNIIKLKAEEINFPETNLSIVTEDNQFFSFDVSYSPDPASLSFVIDSKDKSKQVAMLDEHELTESYKEKLRGAMIKNNRNMRMRDMNNKIIFSVQNIFVKKSILFLKMEILNRSAIDYDIDLIRFYIQDKKISKKTAVQQIFREPLFFFDFKKQIPAKSSQTFIGAFEKFTIPDKKNLIIEIQESNGGRHFLFKLQNKQLMNAEILEGVK